MSFGHELDDLFIQGSENLNEHKIATTYLYSFFGTDSDIK